MEDDTTVGLALADAVSEGEGTGDVEEAVGSGSSEETGVGLSVGGAVADAAGVELPARGVSDGTGVEASVEVGAGALGVLVGVSSGPSAEEARGDERKNKSPASDRAPAGLNRWTFTPSS
ncbi:MAG: hypothetical protein ACE5JF_06640 [Anaerolineales bacterium]